MFDPAQTRSGCHNHTQVSDNIRFDILRGRSITRSLNRLCHVQALNHVPEQVVQALKRLRIISCTDEELAAVGIWARIRHCYRTHRVTALYRLIVELITGSTLACAGWTARLDNRMRYDTVEGQTIIKMLLCQEHKI